jgi:DNA polymerase-3 subunit alpha
LDSFGPRMALLQIMDRAIAISAAQFQAADAGQFTFFGQDSGLVQRIRIPEVDPDYNRREQLNWERELVGLYLSDHPLSPVMDRLKEVITHYSGQMSQVENRQFVRVAGMVTYIRYHQTKKGEPMAFVNLEDTQGVLKLVIFPSTWERVSELIRYDQVVIVEGKIDNERGDPKILVDDIKTEIDVVTSKGFENEMRKKHLSSKGAPQTNPPSVQATVSEYRGEYIKEDNLPPEPDLFPEDWDNSFRDSKDENGDVESAEEGEEDSTSEEEIIEQVVPEAEPVLSKDSDTRRKEIKDVPLTIPSDMLSAGVLVDKLSEEPRIFPPSPPEKGMSTPEEASESQMATIVLRSTGDKARDILRLRRVYGILISEPGNDRFAFYVIERDRGYRFEFPNDTTSISKELQIRLENVVGDGNVIVEPITFQ